MLSNRKQAPCPFAALTGREPMTRSRNPFHRILAVIALFAAVVVLVIGTAQAESPASEDATVKVMPLGDSITDGFNVPGGYRVDLWQKIVAGGDSVDFVGSMTNGPAGLGDRNHEGHSGWTIAQIDGNIVNWLNTYRPQTILLHIGTNDMIRNMGGAPARLSGLLDRITDHSPDTKVFVSTIIPLSSADSAVRTFNAAIPSMVQGKVNAGKKVYLVDMYSALTGSDLADGVHPNAGGYSKMAARWYNALLSVPGSIGNGTGPTTTATSTSTSTTTTTTPVPGACAATARVLNAWNNGYQA
jgi:lysophospholipase L1-like esterase